MTQGMTQGMTQDLAPLLLLRPAVATLMPSLHLTPYQQVQFQKEGGFVVFYQSFVR